MGVFEGPDLDPTDWEAVRRQGHRMVDDMLEHVRGLRDGPVWRPPPAELRAGFREPPPREGAELAEVYGRFAREILPYSSGNAHPGFMGWVQGGGTVVGALADLLSSTMNSNLGGRDHMPLEVEQQIAHWCRAWFGFPEGANGLFLTGTSQANFVALLVARTRALGREARHDGLGETGQRLTAYAATTIHGSMTHAMDIAGLGTSALRRIPVDAAHRIRLDALRDAIAADRAAGRTPFLVVGSAGSVDVGALDDLAGLAEIAGAEGLHFHVDGAIGALGVLSPEVAPRLAGIERADSIAFDWHKWGQVPYDAGFLLVRDGELQKRAFASDNAYLRRHDRGLGGGGWWPSDYGPDLSRSFRALKAWFTVKTYGTDALGAAMARTCRLAGRLGESIAAEPALELVAPVQLNIVAFRHRGPDADALNEEIVARLHEAGLPSPSLTTIDGAIAIRAALVNHRISEADTDALVAHVLRLGREILAERGGDAGR